MVDFLLSRGARYTIFIAALRGDDQYVRDALKRDRSLANFEDTCHQRVLSAAVRRADVPMTKLLLEYGADPNLPEEGAPRGVSLWTAVDKRHRELIELLLAHGADPNAEVESSGTPIGHNKDQAIAELLREHGGRQADPNPEREIVGHLLEGEKLDDAERLLRANPGLIHDDDAGWGDGVLANPAHAQRHDVIAMLMRLGARVPAVSKWAPYYYFKHEATAKFLLEQWMDPNHMNWHRFTLLHHMSAEGEIAKAKMLIDHGADIDAIDEEYRSTPLGVAARRGQIEAVKLLLDRGADPTAAGAPWATSLAWAQAKGHSGIAALLHNASAE
jgi:ankyrin repeat protein